MTGLWEFIQTVSTGETEMVKFSTWDELEKKKKSMTFRTGLNNHYEQINMARLLVLSSFDVKQQNPHVYTGLIT